MHDDGRVDALETDRLIMVTDDMTAVCNVTPAWITHAIQLATVSFVSNVLAEGKDGDDWTDKEARDITAQAASFIVAAAAMLCESWSDEDEAFGKWGDALMEETGKWLDELGYDDRVTMAELASRVLMKELEDLGL